MSEDVDDTLSYTCADDDVVETFSIQTYRYFQAVEGASVYFHCDLKVCLADIAQSACDCPDTVACRPFPTRPPRSPVSRRRRGSVTDIVDETAVYHVTAGPYIFKKNDDVRNIDESDEGTYTTIADEPFLYTAVKRTARAQFPPKLPHANVLKLRSRPL